MASNLHAGLGFDKDNFINKFVVIGEQNNCNSSFLIASLIWHGLYKTDRDTPANICVLSLHNTLEHYENIAIKLGFNIGNHIKKGNLKFSDGFKVFNKYFSNESSVKPSGESDLSNLFLKDLFYNLKENVDSFVKENNNYNYLMIDDLSDLLSVGFSLESILLFVKYLRTLVSSVNGFTLIIGTHFDDSDNEQCVLYRNLYRVADYCITVSGLKTGFSLDVSGGINIVRKYVDVTTGLKEFKKDFYHFKLLDRQIKIFSPGTIH